MKKFFKIMTLALAGVFALASCGDDVPAPNPNPNPGGGDEPATEVVEVTCAEAIELCAALEDNASSAETYAITGYITDVFATISNGQQSFWLSDNNDGQKMVQAYWANLPEGVEKFVAGSKVRITGNLLKYVKTDGTVITEVKNADVEILEAGSDQPGDGALDITCAEAIELCAALEDNASSTETYAITGYITDVYATISNGQQSFWMSDNNDGQKMVQAYWANLPEGVEKFVAGSKVRITGKLLKYVKSGSTEVVTEIKNADVEILEAGGDAPTGEVKHITIAEFLSKADTQNAYELTGIVKNIKNTTYGNFDLVEGDASIYIYGLLDKEGNAKNFESLGISEGDEVTLTGVYVEYNGMAEIKNAQFVSLKKGEGGETGGETGGGDNAFEGADASVVMSEAYSECTSGSVDATPITFDAVQVSFDKNGGSNAPKYYWNATADFCTVRMYAMNSMTVTSDNQIAKIVIKCAAASGSTLYNGNEQMTTTSGSIEKDADNVTIVVDGINQKEVTITNDFTSNSGGTQLRVHSLAVYYVK
ncbi:MAG: hypothetical protein ACI4B5_02540 [Bacteroidaceae bacterium]